MTRDEYIVMVFAGLIPLMAFNESLSTGTASLTSNRSLLTSTVFPPELIPVRALLAAQVPAMLGFSVLLLVTVLTGMATPAAFLMVPVLWVLLAMFCAGLCWILSLVSLVVRDVQQVLPLFMMALLILSPSAYTPEMVPSGLKLLVYLNPLSYFVFSFQALLAFGKMPDASHVAAVACIAFGTFWLGFVFFRKAKYVFFEYA
jgi:lipopolysaccharide transport system permease protein